MPEIRRFITQSSKPLPMLNPSVPDDPLSFLEMITRSPESMGRLRARLMFSDRAQKSNKPLGGN